MLKKLVQLAVVIGIALVLVTVAARSGKKETPKQDPYRYFKTFAKVYDIVLARYVEEVNQAHLMEGAYRGAVESVFDQNSYIPAAIMDRLNERLTEKGRIGIQVAKRGGYAQVIHVVPGSQADREGLTAGTIIQKINGKYTWDLSLFAIRAMLNGPVGEPVTLTYYVMETGEDVDREFQYEVLPPDVSAPASLEDIPILRVQSFGPETLRQARAFAAEHDRVILDLRYNQSRNYSDMMTLAAAVLNRKVTVTMRRRDVIRTLEAGPKQPLAKPVVVLTSSFTMNAGEVFANLVKGQDGVTLMGGRTSGKAFDMELFQLPGGAFVEMATVLYEPTGGEKGIRPDIRSYIDDSEIATELRKLNDPEDREAHGNQTAA